MKASLGISPVISVVLLIAMAASAAAMIAVWQSQFLADYINSVDEDSRLRQYCSSASAELASVSFDCKNSCAEGIAHSFAAQIRNSGDATLNFRKAFLLLKSGSAFEIPFEQGISAGSTRTLTAETVDSCSGILNSVSEVMMPTQCSTLTLRLSGDKINWVNC